MEFSLKTQPYCLRGEAEVCPHAPQGLNLSPPPPPLSFLPPVPLPDSPVKQRASGCAGGCPRPQPAASFQVPLRRPLRDHAAAGAGATRDGDHLLSPEIISGAPGSPPERQERGGWAGCGGGTRPHGNKGAAAGPPPMSCVCARISRGGAGRAEACPGAPHSPAEAGAVPGPAAQGRGHGAPAEGEGGGCGEAQGSRRAPQPGVLLGGRGGRGPGGGALRRGEGGGRGREEARGGGGAEVRTRWGLLLPNGGSHTSASLLLAPHFSAFTRYLPLIHSLISKNLSTP